MYEFKLRIHISGWLILALLLVILLCHFVPAASAAEVLNGFTASSVSSQQKGLGVYDSIFTMGYAFPNELVSLFESLGVNDKVVILAVSASSPYRLQGLYFDESGAFMSAFFENPLGSVHASLFGVYSFSDLVMYGSPSHVTVGSDGYYVYYSEPYAEKREDFMTTGLAVFDFSRPFHFVSASTFGFYFFCKPDTGSTFDPSSYRSFSRASVFKYAPGFVPDEESITWAYQDVVVPDEPTGAVRPVFTVNVPLVPWLEYNVGESADSVTVAADVDDGGTITYEWYRTIYPDSGVAETDFFSEGVSLVPDTSFVSDSSYYCVATNTNGQYSQSAYSNALRVKVLESGAADPPSETPTYPSAEDIGSSVGDAFQDVLDQNDINTSEQGNSFVDQITQIVPNESLGFVNAMGGLVDSLSYGGTECVLTVPALVMPQIGDLVPQYTLLEKQEVDLESYFNMFPDFIVTLVQSLFTVALIVFCFKELYSTVSYFFVLRGGET